jgi:hypothetical protein
VKKSNNSKCSSRRSKELTKLMQKQLFLLHIHLLLLTAAHSESVVDSHEGTTTTLTNECLEGWSERVPPETATTTANLIVGRLPPLLLLLEGDEHLRLPHRHQNAASSDSDSDSEVEATKKMKACGGGGQCPPGARCVYSPLVSQHICCQTRSAAVTPREPFFLLLVPIPNFICT